MDDLTDPVQLDLPSAIAVTGRLVNEWVLSELHAGGFSDVRESDGYVFQHLVDRPQSVGDLAERMGVTQQAVSKRVAEMAARDLVERSFAAHDRRMTMIDLSDRGRQVLRRTRVIRAALEKRLSRVLGSDGVALRRALAAVRSEIGADDLVDSRRIPEPGT